MIAREMGKVQDLPIVDIEADGSTVCDVTFATDAVGRRQVYVYINGICVLNVSKLRQSSTLIIR